MPTLLPDDVRRGGTMEELKERAEIKREERKFEADMFNRLNRGEKIPEGAEKVVELSFHARDAKTGHLMPSIHASYKRKDGTFVAVGTEHIYEDSLKRFRELSPKGADAFLSGEFDRVAELMLKRIRGARHFIQTQERALATAKGKERDSLETTITRYKKALKGDESALEDVRASQKEMFPPRKERK